jgi:hypothetical protein
VISVGLGEMAMRPVRSFLTSRLLTGPASLRRSVKVMESGHQVEPQSDLPEMRISRENLRDAEILHDHHRREIDKGNVRLVVIFPPKLPSAVELFRRDVDKLHNPRSALRRRP